MGWDAYASKRKTPSLKAAFKEAHKLAYKKSNKQGVDGFLGDGGLDCSDSGRALSEMTGFGVYDPYGWPKEQVKDAWDRVQRLRAEPDVFDQDTLWAWWSAYYFLKTCAENDLAIEFSY